MARVIRYLYHDATIYMNRKYEKALTLVNSTNCRLYWKQHRVLLSELLETPEGIDTTAWLETATANVGKIDIIGQSASKPLSPEGYEEGSTTIPPGSRAVA